MNGQQGSDQPGHVSQEAHLAYLLNSAAAGGHGAAGLLGYPGALSAVQRLGFGGGDATSLEEQILQRASALRAEAFLQQQQQQHQQQSHQRQHQLGAALAALQQQQQLAALGMNAGHLSGLSAKEQEMFFGHTAALRELGHGAVGPTMDRFQHLELGRLEELERRRQQLAALASYSGAPTVPRPAEVAAVADKLQESTKSESRPAAKATIASSPAMSTHDSQKTKDDLRKTPGTVIVPCRARGMPMDHNFKTAYFVIAEDTKHGEDLVCSYYSCRNGGVKFRYCAHCMAPVAKRNFCRRHDHGLSDKLSTNEGDDDESMDESNRGVEAEVTERVQSMTSSLDILSNAATCTIATPFVNTKPATLVPPRSQKAKGVTTTTSTEDEYDDAEAELAHISKRRRKAWSLLLDKRPRTKDPRHLSSWLNEVLAVSDFDNDLEWDAPESVTPKAGKAEAESADPPSDKKQTKISGEKKKRKPSGEKTEAKAKKTKTDPVAKQKNVKLEKSSNEKEPKIPVAQVGDTSSQSLVEKGIHHGETPPVNETVELISGDVSDDKPSEFDSKEAEMQVTAPVEDMKQDPGTSSAENREAEDGFAGSFADWRDRKKDKVKKSSGLLKK